MRETPPIRQANSSLSQIRKQIDSEPDGAERKQLSGLVCVALPTVALERRSLRNTDLSFGKMRFLTIANLLR